MASLPSGKMRRVMMAMMMTKIMVILMMIFLMRIFFDDKAMPGPGWIVGRVNFFIQKL